MKRGILVGVALAMVGGILFLCSPVSKQELSGVWYCAEDASPYQFQDGIIMCEQHQIPLSDGQSFSGAYSYAGNKVLLFYTGKEGVGTVQELYLIHTPEGDLLSSRDDGDGSIYFYREKSTAENGWKGKLLKHCRWDLSSSV